jgi:lysophospholipase L1-like esterase
MPAPDKTIVFLGDSITQAPDGYVRLVVDVLRALQPGCRLRTINAGVGGNRSVDLLPRLQRDVLRHLPEIVTISIGINDVWRALDRPGQGLDVPLATFHDAVAHVLDAIIAAGPRPIVLTTSVIGEDLDGEGNRRLVPYNDALKRLAAARNLVVADVNSAFRRVLGVPGAPRLTVDGVHLTHQGNVVLALALLRALAIRIDAGEDWPSAM